MNPPDHTRIRSLVSKAFTPRATERLRASIQQVVDDVKVDNLRHALDASAGKAYLLKVGKRRFAKVTFA